MKYTNANGPQSMACLAYFLMAMMTGMPFFQEGEERLASLRDIYMTSLFDREAVFPLAFSATASLLMSVLYFSKWFSALSSEPLVGRICAALSVALLFLAMTNFGRYAVIACSMGTLFSLWSWWRSDPEDNWL